MTSMHTKDPAVTILMPTYNEEMYVESSVESILRQTFTDFELLIIDDGSTDRTCEKISSYKDPRIRLLKNVENLGLPRTLNRGLKEAKGDYIARQDADDLSHPARLEKQVKTFKKNPDLVILGSQCNMINEEGKHVKKNWRVPGKDIAIRWRSLTSNPFIHSSCMFPIKTLQDHHLFYSEELNYVEDYLLWSNLLKFGKGQNLLDCLIDYRIRPGGITKQNREEQINQHIRVATRNLHAMFHQPSLSDDEIKQLLQHLMGVVYIKNAVTLFIKLADVFHRKYANNSLAHVLHKRNMIYALRLLKKNRYEANRLKKTYKILFKLFTVG